MAKNKTTEILNTGKWEIEHHEDGISFVGFPLYNPHKQKVETAWVIGPCDREVAEWILSAVKLKQQKESAS